jgi:hypothetical protein
VVIWYIFLRVGKLYQEKSGNPGRAYKSNQKDVLSQSMGLLLKLFNFFAEMKCSKNYQISEISGSKFAQI